MSINTSNQPNQIQGQQPLLDDDAAAEEEPATISAPEPFSYKKEAWVMFNMGWPYAPSEMNPASH